jgi:tetratricopeptide (TPR) repeat protein
MVRFPVSTAAPKYDPKVFDRGTSGLRRPVRVLAAVALAVLVLGSAACKSAEEKAQESLQRGLSAHAAGKIPDARAAYRETLENDPTNAFALYNLGLISQEDGDPTLAEGFYRDAIASDPNFTSALYNLAILRGNAGDFGEAASLYQRVTVLKPDYAPAHLNYGFALRELGQFDEGNEELKLAIGLDPDLGDRIPPKVLKELGETSG